jgi:hypothetical protein
LIVLAVEGFYTLEQQRELVYEYLAVPYGGKARFMTERGLTWGQVRRWRAQVFADTLEQGLVPRGGGVVSMDEARAVRRLVEENRALQDQLAAKDADLAVQRRAVEALGKAIEILHRSGESKNSTEPAAAPGPPAKPPRRRR